MSPLLIALLMPSQSFPRVSGDEPPIDYYVVERRVFSPRERG